MPRVTLDELYKAKPGAMVARVPSFTAGLGNPYDKRGWNYVHLDEALEMLIIRLVKGMIVKMLPYLETAGAWLLPVSHARMRIRSVTAASRTYKPQRGEDTAGQECSLLRQYDKTAIQSSTVSAMLELLRKKGFLSVDHRNSEKLCNVLGSEDEELKDKKVQDLILNVERHG